MPTPGPAEPSLPPAAPRATRVAEILQTVLTGLILAFIFRAFLVEAFIIPTGSMADTLLGAHATRVCPACGWEFDFAPLRTAAPGAGFVVPPEIICPNCQFAFEATPTDTAPKAGDRILVHKWPYALAGLCPPQRWDVIVFRDPADPDQHYIKRLVGQPGETVELVDGDVFIDGRIARKPPEVQATLWMVVFDQAHLASANAPSGRLPRWIALDPPDPTGAGWAGLDQRTIRYDGLDQTGREIIFNADTGTEYLLDLYAYNRHSSGAFVGDVRIVAEFTPRAGNGVCRWELLRSPQRFFAELHRDGHVVLGAEALDAAGCTFTLDEHLNTALALGRPVAVEFGHVDFRVYLTIDGQEVLSSTDELYAPRLEHLRTAARARPVGLRIGARDLACELRRLRIDRDVHYTSRPVQALRATTGRPFTLLAEEYFVMGDNSPDSHDSREWTEAGPHLPPDYRPGTVRADQIVGQAAFVYLPGLLPLGTGARWSVPDIGRVRFVR